MYTLSQIRTRVNALKRKYALELQIIRIHRIAEDFSLRWVRAEGDRQPLPETHAFILHIADNGFRFHTFMNLHTYLERCRTNGDTPDCWGIIRSLYANHDLDRISRIVDNCHTLPEPDPDECAQRLEDRRPRSMINDLIYWMNRWLDRVLRTNDAFAASLASVASPATVASAATVAAPRQENTHQTTRAWRRRQQRNTPTQTPPSPYGRGAKGEGHPPNHVILSAAEGSKIHTTYHAQPTATNPENQTSPLCNWSDGHPFHPRHQASWKTADHPVINLSSTPASSYKTTGYERI